MEDGASAAGWRPSTFIVPLAVGWVIQALIGAWTHLVPAVGPGDHARHARQRGLLGRFALSRWWAFQAGVAALALGLPIERPDLAILGALLLVAWAGYRSCFLPPHSRLLNGDDPGVTPIATTDAA